MNTEHRYNLEKGSKKHICPDCGKSRFVRFIDIETSQYLPDQYGRCDSGDGHYFLNPYSDGYAKAMRDQESRSTATLPRSQPIRKQPQPPADPVYFHHRTFMQTLRPERYGENIFVQNLVKRVPFPFESEDVFRAVKLYRLGTIVKGERLGAVTFPFIDERDNVRAIQVKQFDQTNHTISTDFLHSIIERDHKRKDTSPPAWLQAYLKQDKRVSCLFGAHLLPRYPHSPVALVEAPKTAIYGTLYGSGSTIPILKDCIWLAVYNKSSFSFDKIKALAGRTVYVFPDLSKDGSTFSEWQRKAKEYEARLQGTRFVFSDLLEKYGTPEQREKGADIADILIKLDWRTFRKRNIQEQPPQPEPEKVTKVTKVTHQQNIYFSHAEPLQKVEVFKTERIEPPIKEQPQNWSHEIEGLEAYFNAIDIPDGPIKFNSCSTITDPHKFITSHTIMIRANIDKRAFEPYLIRLQQLRGILAEGYSL